MSRRKKKARVFSIGRGKPGLAKALRLADRIFSALPDGARSGQVYYDVLRECGVADKEAKAIAGVWMLERSRMKPN